MTKKSSRGMKKIKVNKTYLQEQQNAITSLLAEIKATEELVKYTRHDEFLFELKDEEKNLKDILLKK